jgi:hypothetical protein
MALKPEFSIVGGLALAAIVFAIHSNATPSQADIQALPAGVPDIDRAEKNATIMSAGVVAGISLVARDPAIFIIGSAMAIGMAWWTRNSNWTESVGGKYLTQAEEGKAGSANTGPAVAETQAYQPFASDFAR